MLSSCDSAPQLVLNAGNTILFTLDGCEESVALYTVHFFLRAHEELQNVAAVRSKKRALLINRHPSQGKMLHAAEITLDRRPTTVAPSAK